MSHTTQDNTERKSRAEALTCHRITPPPSSQGDLLRPKAQDLIPRVGLLAGSGRAPECLWTGAAVPKKPFKYCTVQNQQQLRSPMAGRA